MNVTSVRKGEEGTAIPVPDPEVGTLGQAIRSFILWPRNLIGSDATPPMVGITLLLLKICWHPNNNLFFDVLKG